jgi:hypothetical protein
MDLLRAKTCIDFMYAMQFYLKALGWTDLICKLYS